MCTMTWWKSPDNGEKFSVFFNRDESKERSIAKPPAEFVTYSGIRFLMPTDPDAGGTWMLANEHGIVVTLLNWYDKAVPYSERVARFRSRGLLVKGLAESRDLDELEVSLDKAVVGATYRPFHLLGFGPNEVPRQWSWDGNFLSMNEQGDKLARQRPEDSRGAKPKGSPTHQHGLFGERTLLLRGREEMLPLVSSSSFETERVLASRRDAFLALNPQSIDDFVAFQTNSRDVATAFTPRMNRPDAQTWSRSQVDVSRDGIVFKYVAESPDLSDEGVAFESYLNRS